MGWNGSDGQEMSRVGIAEIFYSLQGEGFHAGRAAIFIRTAGCNLACDFCDTDFTVREKLTPEEIFVRIKNYSSRFIVLTGGEPTIQAQGCTELIKFLQDQGYYVAMETNGSSHDTLGVNWVTVSPKLSQKGEWLLKQGDELKLVYEAQDLSFYENSDFQHYLLQPKEIRTGHFGKGERDIQATRNEWNTTIAAVQQNPKWKLSFQIHKELGLR